MKTYLSSAPRGGRWCGILLCLLMFSGTALAADEWHSWEGSSDPNIVKESTPEADGGRTDRYYLKNADGTKQLVEINKFKKGGEGKLFEFYHWLRHTDENGTTTTEEYSRTKDGGFEGTKTQVKKDGTTTTWTWDKDHWKLKDIKKPETAGPKKAPEPHPVNPPTETGEDGLFHFEAGYSFMQADEDEVRDLNGFHTGLFYNVQPWLAVGAQFSGLYGSKNIGMVDVSLDRYLYLFGVRATAQAGEPVQLFVQVMVGGVHDINDFNFPGGSSSSSADAFAASLGVGVDFRVTRSFSIGPSFDYLPTNFSGGSSNWQDNWRANLTGRYHFGGRRGP